MTSAAHTRGATPIQDYAMIGNCRSAALVSKSGAIDWLCWPRFDSDACFAALLGTSEHGHWTIGPTSAVVRRERRYRRNTLIMETDLHTETGALRLIDFMPMRNGASTLIRIVTGLHGTVRAATNLKLRFGYGQMPPWIERTDKGFIARIGPDRVCLYAPLAVSLEGDEVTACFDIRQGERLAFVLRYSHADAEAPGAVDTEIALSATQQFWRGWINRFDDSRTRWPDAVRRSLITLKALIHQPSGGLVAAPTTSLPEAPGGKLNWDYRYCWLRDASFTVTALVNAGFTDEAERWRDWVLRTLGGTPGNMQIMYRVDGARYLDEREIAGLPGWRDARPIRAGNLAATQDQLDVYGELLNALELCRAAGMKEAQHEAEVFRRVVQHLAERWNIPGSGIWESRGENRRYTYSKAMSAVGLDCFLRRHAHHAGSADLVSRLRGIRDIIRAGVLSTGWNEGLGTFTTFYGGQELDASLLLMPLIGFIDATDPRMAATIAAIERDLSEGGLIRRSKRSVVGPSEGAFLACSCWMADCLDLLGRHDEAIGHFERVLAVRNDVGLLSEEYDVPGKHLSGNFPQALTHLSVVNTALGLCGPVLGRGDGGG